MSTLRKTCYLSALGAIFLTTATAVHAQFGRNFGVDFTDCTEFAGEGPVSLAVAKPLVPDGYTIAKVGGNANIVVRATGCKEVTVNKLHSQPTNLSQIGINIVAPDGTGDINNYTLIYVSNNPFLIEAFLAAGLPATYDPQLTYEFNAPSAATSGNLYVAVGDLFQPPYFIYGPEGTQPAAPVPFLANWWYASPFGQMRQQTLLPNIAFATSSVTLYTGATTPLGKLIGGNTFSNYSVLALHGYYPSGHMDVTVK
jgi:hypothetical protein